MLASSFSVLSASAVLVLVPVLWIVFFEKKRVVEGLGLRSFDLRKDVFWGLAGFFALVLLVLVPGALIDAFFSGDSGFVASAILAQPFYVIVLLLVVQVPAEELFFRGFLVDRIGVLPSALVFGLAHFSYGSVSEVVLAVLAGGVLGFVFVKRKNVFTTLISHELLNLMTLIMIYSSFSLAGGCVV